MAFSTTLTADLGSADLIVSVADNTGARTTYPWRATIGSEVIYVTDGVGEGLDWTILRGADGTDPVEHLTGSTLIEAPLRSVVFSDTDPGAIGAGQIWVQDLSAIYGGPASQAWIRNQTDDGWIPLGPPTTGLLGADAFTIFTALTDGAEVSYSDSGSVVSIAPEGHAFRTGSAAFGGAATTKLIHGTVDPTAGGGVDVNPGSLFVRNNADTRELWFKTGDAATDWIKLTP